MVRRTNFPLAIALLGLALRVAAQQIPALVELSADIAAARPDLAGQRATLVQERQALHARIDQHNQECGKVDSEDKAKVAACSSKRTELGVALRAHIASSEAYNAAARAAVERAACSQVPRLQDQFQFLSQQVEVNRQIIHNFGFEKTVEQIEYWGRLPERQAEDAKKAFRGLLLDATLSSVTKVVGAVGSLTPEEVGALNRLAEAQGAPPLDIAAGAKDVHTALEFLESAKHVYETVDHAKKGEMLAVAVKLGGLASKNPAFGMLLTADEWAGYQVYESVNAVRTVSSLTGLNEGDLVLLKSRSEKLKDEVKELTAVKKQLAELGSKCDSTKLVK